MVMHYNPEIHHRKPIRLKEYDYSREGYYFLTMCAYNRENLFGKVIDGVMILNEFGNILKNELLKTEEIRKEIKIDSYVIMPNHLHLVIQIDIVTDKESIQDDINVGTNGRSSKRMQPKSISSFVSGFKSVCTKLVNAIRNSPGMPVWQQSFYEHIIRNEKELNEIRKYIEYNPLNWEKDNDNLELNFDFKD